MDQPHHISEDLQKIAARLEFENQELKVKLNEIQKKVKELLTAKDVWMKDIKNYQNKTIFFSKETELKSLVYPKPVAQAKFNWLAQ